jgi:hypothetical protein
LTAGWKPGTGTTDEALAAARKALAATLATGKRLAEVHPGRPAVGAVTSDTNTVAEIEQLLAQPEALSAPPVMAYVQSALSASVQNPTNIPAWARGMTVQKVHGPFLDVNGISHWVHFIPLTFSEGFAFGGPANEFAVFPVRLSFLPHPPGQIMLGAGSVWFLSKLLLSALPAGNVSGFRISGGVLKLSAPGAVQNNIYVLPANATLTMTATLAPPPAGTAVGAIGADAAASTITLPKTVTIVFTQSGATVQALDDSSLQVYGSTLNLTWNKKAIDAIDSNTWLVIPCDANSQSFAFVSAQSKEFTPSGTAAVSRTGWALPIATTPITSVGEAAGAGVLLLQLGAGASLQCEAHPAKTSVAPWQFLLAPGFIFAIVPEGGPDFTTSYDLWQERKPSTRRSSVAFTSVKGALISFLAVPGSEILSALGIAAAHLDRPLAADGSRIPMFGGAILQIGVTATNKVVLLLAVEPQPLESDFPIALENALIGVHGPALFAVVGPVDDHTFRNATVVVLFQGRWLLPTLPDPYAASFGLELIGQESDNGIGILDVVLTWAGQQEVDFNFFLLPGANQPALTTGANLQKNSALTSEALVRSELTTVQSAGQFALLDLSTRVDQFGVAFLTGYYRRLGDNASTSGTPAPAMGFEGLSLAVNGAFVATFALPQVSWEPMESTDLPSGPIRCSPASDGIPLLVQAPDEQQLVPFAPGPVLSTNIRNVAAGRPFTADFSLPFGLIAKIRQPNEAPTGGSQKSLFLSQDGAFHLTRPKFAAKLTGALQLTLKPPNPEKPSAQFDGETIIFQHHTGEEYGDQVLGNMSGVASVADIFNGEFGTGESNPPTNPGVPVLRADLAGYGASIWSEWFDDVSVPPDITKVNFETVVGRTALEVIQAATILYPYGPKLVRTITIQRQNTGWMQRTDSGWQPVTHGLFEFPIPNTWANRVHRGPVAGVFNLRNIRELPDVFNCDPAGPTPHKFQFRKVLFDADIGIDYRINVVSGGKASTLKDAGNNPVTLVPARDLVGYIQLAPDKETAPPEILVELFAQTGPVKPAFSCVVQAGSLGVQAGTVLRASAIEVAMATQPFGPTAPAMGAALRAAPNLPRDGHWGVGRRGSTDAAPAALGNDFPAPLVQSLSDLTNWHIADIADVLQLAKPDNIYGILQDTGTQKILFEQPMIPLAGATPGIQLPNPPNFADVASLLNATGLFPDLSSTITLFTGGVEQLNNMKDGLQYKKTFTFDVNKPPLPLLDIGVLQVALSYCDESQGRTGTGAAKAPTVLTYNLDPAAVAPAQRWSFSVTPLTFLVNVPEFSSDPLLMVVGGFVADDQTKPTLSQLHVVYGPALASLTNVLDKLQALAQFLPGGKGAGLQVGLSDGKLTVSDTFAIPSLPLGLGEITDVSLDIGLTLQLSPLSADFSVGIGGPDNPFNWIVSPLAGNGLIDVGVKDNKPELTVQGGIGLGLAIDVGIAEGSASITIAARLDITGGTVTLMAILTGQASVDVLGGLASASLTLTAAVGFSMKPFPPLPKPTGGIPPTGLDFPSVDITLLASVSVGIHISICWVVSVDFDGSWQLAQTIHTPELQLSL